MLRLNLDKQTQKVLKRLTPKHAKQVAAQIQNLRSNPRPHDSEIIDSSPPPILRNTIGEYRIVYTHDKSCLAVLKIGKRNDGEVYKGNFRKLREKLLN